jgi:hypothetical protein
MTPEEKLPLLTRPTLENLYKNSQQVIAHSTPLISRGYLPTTIGHLLLDANDKIKAEIRARGGTFNEFGGIVWNQ